MITSYCNRRRIPHLISTTMANTPCGCNLSHQQTRFCNNPVNIVLQRNQVYTRTSTGGAYIYRMCSCYRPGPPREVEYNIDGNGNYSKYWKTDEGKYD